MIRDDPTSAVPERKKRSAGSTKSVPSREQPAQRAPADSPDSPLSAASNKEALRETLQKLGQLCQLVTRPH